MNTLRSWFWICCLIIFMGCLAGCSPSSAGAPAATSMPALGEAPPLQSGQTRQWAAGAEASSEYADPEWAASQAAGPPDTPNCGDYQTAWATGGSDTVATLVLTYTLSVHVTGINIVQTFKPNQVTEVELVGEFNRARTVYEGNPVQVDQPCPYTLTIPVQKTEQLYNTVRITVDQSVLGLGWNQIDAVELVGEAADP